MIALDQARDAREDIEQFLTWLLAFFDSLLRHPSLGTRDGPLFDPAIFGQLQEAWPEFREDFNGSKWQGKVNDTSSTALEAHGLYGRQLALKLWAIRYLLARFVRDIGEQQASGLAAPAGWDEPVRASALASASSAVSHEGRLDKIKAAFKKLIEGVDIFLESVFTATGINGSVVEIKKMFGLSIDD
jgi:hypothetical protein